MKHARVSRRYVRLRLALALGSAFLAAVVSQQITQRLSAAVVARSELADVLDEVQLSIANMMMAFMQIRLAGDSQQAEIVRGELRRGARLVLDGKSRMSVALGGDAVGEQTRAIIADPQLDPIRLIEDVAMIAMAAGGDSSPFGPRATRISTAGLDVSKRLLPVLKRMKETEREAHEAASLQLARGGWWTLALSALVLIATALLLVLPMERRILTAQDEIERRREAAERASEAKTQFLATMSHEIRTPMNGVLGMADVLRTTGLDPRQQTMLDIIVQSGKALMEIINGVLDLAKIESGRLELVEAPFDLREVIEEVVALFSGAAASKGIALSAAIDPRLAATHEGDAGAMRQILSNLVGNAVKFTLSGAVTVTAMPDRGHAHRDGVRLQVRDTGVGIPVEAQGRVFESFEQADANTTRRFGGSGLGLAIVSRLVAAMGGQIELDSTPGLGSTFSVILPMRVAQQAAPVPAGPSAALRPQCSLAGLRVLVAEDNPINQTVVGAMLGQFGCEVEIAADGLEAIAAYRRSRPDIILMDVSMPRLDGHAATAAIRAVEQAEGAAHVPIIGLSAHALADAERDGHDSGMDLFLTKPISADALGAALRRQVQHPERPPRIRLEATEAS